ncbi:hypothetical protein POM88_034227 [Heracleum sosnowskyi]|uniref:F-box domain-containing protein n=1 Tax=Heracleum sosnowskyi TaxID=360622 RepID=A0AAD8HIV3_9APIA|nr:hypothetical protein POM88_034227 [Heracleum sosnowskyi]
MAECTKRKFGDIRIDRISMLPRQIQESILCFLPIRDAVRTSILSQCRRHCWTTIPLLNFDYQFFIDMMVKSRSYEVDEKKFVSAIYGVLLLDNGQLILDRYSYCLTTSEYFSLSGGSLS